MCIVCASLAIPACASLNEPQTVSSDVASVVAKLSPGEKCRVTLRPVEEATRAFSQLTYEGTVSLVASNELVLSDSKLVATSKEAPPIETLPFIDRHFCRTAEFHQSLTEPVSIPTLKIERIAKLDSEVAAREVPAIDR